MPRTLIKHQVYRHYLQCWMGKICGRFETSAVVDAFAGPGEYLDGPDGSPLVIAKTFLDHSANARFNQFRLVCLEKRSDRREHLLTRLATLPYSPKLTRTVMDCGEAAESHPLLDRAAHDGSGEIPTIWILDPYDWTGVPFTLVRACLIRPHDEVMVTWFADEIYRFCGDPRKANGLDRHFGGPHWRTALSATRESDRKIALLDAYKSGLRQLPGILTSDVSISSKNETVRYSLVFATHSDHGLACFNPVGWKLDPVQGKMISEKRGMAQQDLFVASPVINSLQRRLMEFAGSAVSFHRLIAEAQRLGYLDRHLRLVLDALATEGMAVREHPLKARTRWPTDSVIRFYPLTGGSES